MRITISLSISSFLFFLMSCGSIKNVEDTADHIKLITSERLNGKIELLYNSDSTKVICIGEKENLSQSYSFFVYSTTTNKAISQTFNNISRVMWFDNHTIKYKYLSGTVKVGENGPEFTFINFKD